MFFVLMTQLALAGWRAEAEVSIEVGGSPDAHREMSESFRGVPARAPLSTWLNGLVVAAVAVRQPIDPIVALEAQYTIWPNLSTHSIAYMMKGEILPPLEPMPTRVLHEGTVGLQFSPLQGEIRSRFGTVPLAG
ncbi:MAG: hypothetical protein HN348_14700, partial [Proteobacteria bacterium]|nr:hypothetical protein [Pseudomonadota bacterium]